MYVCIDDFKVSINDSIFSGNEQQKVYLVHKLSNSHIVPQKHIYQLLLIH